MLETGSTTCCQSKEAAFGFAGLMYSDSEMHRETKSSINILSFQPHVAEVKKQPSIVEKATPQRREG